MPGAGEVRVREADDAVVVVAVAGGPAIRFVARLDPGVRAELDHAERHHGAGEGVAFAAGADEGIDGGDGIRVGDRGHGASRQQQPAHQCPDRQPPPARLPVHVMLRGRPSPPIWIVTIRER